MKCWKKSAREAWASSSVADAAESYQQLAFAYQVSGKYDQAAANFLKAMELQHEDAAWIVAMREAYRSGGIRAFWRRHVWVLQQKSKKAFVGQMNLPLGALSGDDDRAFEALNKAFEDHEANMAGLNSEPGLNTLHSDPRWVGLLRRMNLPEPERVAKMSWICLFAV